MSVSHREDPDSNLGLHGSYVVDRVAVEEVVVPVLSVPPLPTVNRHSISVLHLISFIVSDTEPEGRQLPNY